MIGVDFGVNVPYNKGGYGLKTLKNDGDVTK